MIRIRYVVLALFLMTITHAQVLEWTPYFATDTSGIEIIYDASKGNGALVGVIPVYYHTGVITNLSTSPSDWRYVKTTWGVASNNPMMQYMGGTKWKLTLPSLRTYYGVPANEQILKLAFVFRNANGSITGKEADGSDIFLPLSQPGLNVKITTPTEQPKIILPNESVTINALSLESTSLTLFINGAQVANTAGTSITHTTSFPSAGKYWILAVAQGAGGAVKKDSMYIAVRGAVQTAAVPTGMRDGINYTSPNSATLVLYAPEKQYIYVLGDFNNWEADPLHFMKQSPDGKRWWVEITNLTPMQEYGFQYLVDNSMRVADPYAELVLDPWNDKYITGTRYPNLKPYPAEKTTLPVSVLQTGQQPYQWKYSAGYQRPPKENLIIYELLVRDYTSKASYQGVIDSLEHILSMGVNAIELMPIMEFEGNESWGYNPSFHLAVDKYYGHKNMLKKFIDTCHSRGVAVILDMVLNHAFGQSPLVRLYWDAANNRPAANSPWFNPVAKHPYNVGYDFNHESDATKYFVDRVLEFWLSEYKFDGFRFDLSKGFTQVNSGSNVGLWGQYDQSRINIWNRIAAAMRLVDPTAYIILEHFADNSEEIALSNNDMLLWGNMNYNYSEASMGWHDNNKSNFSGASYKNRNWTKPHLIAYAESHDEERIMYRNIQYGNSNAAYNIKNPLIGYDRMKLVGAFLFTIPGPKMLWQFQEVGYDYTIEFNGRTGNKPVRWDYARDPKRKNIHKVYKYLIGLKRDYPAFSSSDFSIDAGSSMKRISINHATMNVNVLGNFDVLQKPITPQFSTTGWWYDYFLGDSINVTNVNDQITLQPGEFRIYTTKRLPVPEQGILSGLEREGSDDMVTEYHLGQNFPNPFNPVTSIRFALPNSGNVRLTVYNLLGQEVRTLVNDYLTSGTYSFDFSADGLASGIYFYRLQAGNTVLTKKMTVLK